MTLRDAAVLAGGNLLKDPVRTILTILGLAVGVGAILTVLTLGGAGQMQVEAEISRMGVDKVWITAEEKSERGFREDDSAYAAQAAGASVCAGAGTIAAVALGETVCTAQINGYDESVADVHQPVITEGRMILPAEHRSGAAVALVDESLAQRLGGNVCGRRIYIGSRAVHVIGVMRDMTVQAAGVSAGMVILPLNTFLSTFTSAGINGLTISVPSGRKAEEVGAAVTAALGEIGGRFRASSLQDEIDAAKSVIRIFVMVLECVAAVCMLTGSIGVMNILLVSVRERRREIGLIKAVGGTARQVGGLFLLEAVSYAVSGCLLGLVLGCIMVHVFGTWIGLDTAVSTQTAALTMFAACGLGVVCGVAPALRAAGMVPVEALRGE